MPTVQRILCAVETGLDELNVMACACMMARPFRARIDTLRVRDGLRPAASSDTPLERLDETDARRKAELLFAGLLEAIPGSRVPDTVVSRHLGVILEHSEKCASDLIVLGLRHSSAVGRERVPALADDLSRAAACPVMTVPAVTPATPISRILLPVDFSRATARAVEWAATLAQRFSATVHVLHAVGSSGSREAPAHGKPLRTTLDRARDRLREIEQRLRALTVSCESSLVEGAATHAILAHREQLDSELIVMGSHLRGSDRRAAPGLVATIRYRASVPVISMTTPDSDGPFVLGYPMSSSMGAMYGTASSASAP